MNQYLLVDENRAAVHGHNEDLVVTTVRTVGKGSLTSYDFNREEEYRQLDAVIAAPDLDTQTARTIADSVYGADDESLVKRVRANLSFNSPYQRRLINGTAVLARKDGTLRITHSPDEYGVIVAENLAQKADAMKRTVGRSAKAIDRIAATAVDKVPELAEDIAELRTQMRTSLSAVFATQLELLAGDA